ncbi:hypothetical protein QUA46_01565 [Microcoleus sp. MON2_D6]|uniref:hypothetical protein n=1 Tax=unclassified Microcoleus TaxID=2642155 RepID=UPI002FD3D87B
MPNAFDPILYAVSQVLLRMVSRRQAGGTGAMEKTDCTAAIPSFFGFWSATNLLNTIDPFDRPLFPIRLHNRIHPWK